MNKIELASMIKSNRPDDLKEWANYYLALGYDRITIYDNESPFSIKDLFSGYKNIEVRPVKSYENFTAFAAYLYDETSKEKRGQTEWLSFFDNDEYLWLKNSNNIHDILKDEFLVLCFYWKFISLPNIIESRKSTTIDTFNYTSMNTPCSNRAHVKSTVNLNKCHDLKWHSVHWPVANSQNIGCTVDGVSVGFEHTPITDNFYDNQSALLYHYFYQSYEDWLFKTEKNPDYKCSREDFESYIVGKYNTLDNNIINKKKELGI
jgi:hypothetical protein